MEIVTGHRGTPHITPYKVRDFNIGTVGAEDYVMNSGSELEAQLVSNNRIDIKDGSICMQGTHAVIPKNINDELTIENGMQGEKRIDLIVARYEKVADSGVESVNTVVLQGTPSKETPNVPGHVVGDIRNGDLKHEMPLYEVELDGINITEVRPVFKKLVSAAEQQKMIESLNGKTDLKIIEKHIDTGYLKSGVHFYKRNSFGQIHFSSLQGWSLPYATTKLCDFPDGYRPALRKKGVLYFGAEAVGFVEIRTDGLFATSIKELNSQTSYLNCDISYWIE